MRAGTKDHVGGRWVQGGPILGFEDPVTIDGWEMYAEDGHVVLRNEETGHTLWMRASDAATIGEWLQRTFAAVDWRTP